MNRRAFALIIGILSGVPAALSAQEKPVVFLHGLASSTSAWSATASRLEKQLLIRPVVPALDWRASLAQQAQGLQNDAATRSLPAATIVVGHSNGGLVARQWSRQRSVDGILTIGTPHAGAPIVSRLGTWVSHAAATNTYVARVFNAFNQQSSFTWILAELAAEIVTANHFANLAAEALLGIVPLHVAAPVFTDMRPGATIITQLNSSSNLSREAQAVRGRVGISTIVRDYAYGGPFRAIAPENADAITYAFYGAIASLEYRAAWILARAPHGDAAAIQQAQSLLSLAGHLRVVDPLYCASVSAPSGTGCIAHDGIVPHSSQRYPGAANTLLSPGPTHIRQTDQTDTALINALVGTMRVSRRTAAPTPPPPPPPPPQGPQPPNTPELPGPSPSRTDVLLPGESLLAGEHVASQDRRYALVYQGDGNLVLYRGSNALWHSGTYGTSPGRVIMQGDGNLVVYDSSNRARWASGTQGHPNAYLVVQNDGNVVIYSRSNSPLWDTETWE
jgi:pimeloyl-ACP methyl ester carboxylesterase